MGGSLQRRCCIVSVSVFSDLLGETVFLCAGWLLAEWDGWEGWEGWDVGVKGVGWTNASRLQNGSSTIGAVTGSPPLALEGRQAVGSGGWHQLFRCCKGAEYFYRSSKIIQIYFTKIGNNM